MKPWILYDFRTPRRINHFQQGFNLKGLIGADKQRKKQAFYVLQQFYWEKKKQEAASSRLRETRWGGLFFERDQR